MASSNSDLIRRAKSGDRSAFVEIYQAHYQQVYGYIYYRVSDEPTAQDIASEVFARMVEKVHTFNDTGRPILAWLYTIARNLIYDSGRVGKRFSDSELDKLPLRSESLDPSDMAHWSLTQKDLADAMQHLTENQREVVLLRFVHGYKLREIGEQLGKSEGAIKLLQHRALAAMKDILTGEFGYDG